MNTQLILEDLCLPVLLGVTSKERARQQVVLVTIKISFLQPPLACDTDQLSDTVCYDSLIKKIEEFCSDKEFNLVENLSVKLFKLIKKELPEGSKLHLSVAKQKPVSNLGQSVFEVSD